MTPEPGESIKTIFDTSASEHLIQRIHLLDEHNKPVWGKMNVCQMLTHCCLWDEWMLGKNGPQYKQAFLGKIFGKMALRKMIKDNKPLDRNVPTSNWLKIKETPGNIEQLKTAWISLIKEYAEYSNPNFVHDFFGKMTIQEIGILAYKHADHHLRQFGI